MSEGVGVPIDGGESTTSTLRDVVGAARRRLGRLEVRRALSHRAGCLCVVAALGAATRPLAWPLRDSAVWHAVIRSALLAGIGTSIVVLIVVVWSWRRRPSLLTSARALDHALGLAEVVASGFAFERDGRNDEMALCAVARARRAVAGLDIDSVLRPVPSARTKNERLRLAGAVLAAVVGLAIGGIDRIVVERAIHPVTQREAEAAAELKKAAEHAAANARVARDAIEPKDPKADALFEAARRASEAARRGDRKTAQEALDDMRKAARAIEADDRDQARSLRAMRDQLEAAAAAAKATNEGAGTEGRGGERPSATASEALARLKKELEGAGSDKEAIAKMLDRLERAESTARSASEKANARGTGKQGERAEDPRAAAWSRAASALKEARESAARGDAEGAKRAMDRAERELAALEKSSRDPAKATGLAQLSEGASELDRSMHAAMTGKPLSGEPGDGARNGKDGPGGSDPGSEGKNGNASTGKGDPSGLPGGGPGAGDRAPGAEQRRLKISGDLQARTDVREGERAVSAIEGMGRGGDPKAYAEIFPSYDTIVEDGLREETVPAARRPVVRRYFSSIRPGGDEQEGRNRP